MIESINIRPTVQILTKFRSFPHKQQYALAEFVDNSIQSFLYDKDKIKSVDGSDAQIEITIEFDSANDKLTIKDNAAGIKEADYGRAFLTGEDPPDTEGLSEFGMGMKVAAIWYAKNCTVETTTIGETDKRTVEWDTDQLVDNIPVRTSKVHLNEHGTTITLRNLTRRPYGRGYGSIRDHLGNIYQWFLRRGQLKLTCLGESLSAHDLPEILHGPAFDDLCAPEEQWKTWQKHINFTESGISVKGFVAVADRGATQPTSGYGFSLLRKRRTVKAGYKPYAIFGDSYSTGKYQRLFGELHFDNNVGVTFSKDDFDWDEITEQSVWARLATELEAKPMQIISHANAPYSETRPGRPPEPEPEHEHEHEPEPEIEHEPEPEPEPEHEHEPEPEIEHEPEPEPEPEIEHEPEPEPEPEIDARRMVQVTIGDEEKLLDPEQQIVYFHLLPKLPENGVIKVGVTTVSGLNGRIGDPQRYFVEDVECLGVIPLGTRKEAEDKENELLEMFGRVNENRQQCELIWDTDDVRQYIEEECEDAIFYTEASSKSG